MDHFTYRNAELHCESVPLRAVADAVGTPTYIYSRAALLDSYSAYDRAFATVPHVICYAVKANANLAVLRVFARLGAGADVVYDALGHDEKSYGAPARLQLLQNSVAWLLRED